MKFFWAAQSFLEMDSSYQTTMTMFSFSPIHNLMCFDTSCVNFIKKICARYSYKILAPKTTKLAFGFKNFGAKNSKAVLYEKRVRKMLMKLTPSVNFINILLAPLNLVFVIWNSSEFEWIRPSLLDSALLIGCPTDIELAK